MIEHWQYHKSQKSRRQQPANHDGGKRALDLRSWAGGIEHRNQAENCYGSSHQHRS